MVDFTPAQRADYVKIIFENVDWVVVEQRCRALKTPQVAHA
jgi:superoxide dismutase